MRAALNRDADLDHVESYLFNKLQPVAPRSAYIGTLRDKLLDQNAEVDLQPDLFYLMILGLTGLILSLVVLMIGARAMAAVLHSVRSGHLLRRAS